MDSMAKKDLLDGYDPVAAGEQDEAGVDLEGLRYNLTLTPEQRFEQHNRALANYIAIRNAGIAARRNETRRRNSELRS